MEDKDKAPKNEQKKVGKNKATVVKNPDAPVYNHPKMTTIVDVAIAKKKRDAVAERKRNAEK